MSRSRFAKSARVAALGLMLSLAPATLAQTGGTGGGGTTGGTGTGGGTGGGGGGTTRVDDSNRGFDWGWLGLLGLLGLAGMRRPRTHEGHMGRAAHA